MLTGIALGGLSQFVRLCSITGVKWKLSGHEIPYASITTLVIDCFTIRNQIEISSCSGMYLLEIHYHIARVVAGWCWVGRTKASGRQGIGFFCMVRGGKKAINSGEVQEVQGQGLGGPERNKGLPGDVEQRQNAASSSL